jgi:hypothetical protein
MEAVNIWTFLQQAGANTKCVVAQLALAVLQKRGVL